MTFAIITRVEWRGRGLGAIDEGKTRTMMEQCRETVYDAVQ